MPNESLTVPHAAPSPWPEVWIGPVRVHDIRRGEIIDVLAADSPEPRLIANVNAHAINLALKDPEFLHILNTAHACFCDGFGVMVLARIFRCGRIRDRTTMPGFVEEVAARLHAEGKRKRNGPVSWPERITVLSCAMPLRKTRRWPGCVRRGPMS